MQAFDGADDIDFNLNVIKGGGACHFQEKVVLEQSKRNVCAILKYAISPEGEI